MSSEKLLHIFVVGSEESPANPKTVTDTKKKVTKSIKENKHISLGHPFCSYSIPVTSIQKSIFHLYTKTQPSTQKNIDAFEKALDQAINGDCILVWPYPLFITHFDH
jgi:hypothetical protein